MPESFKEPNLGVVFYRQCAAIEQMFDDAVRRYDELTTPRNGSPAAVYYDQTAVRLALYASTVRLTTLTDEDNCRFANYGKLNGAVRVLHGRSPRAAHTAANLQRVLERLNATTVPRVFVAGRIWALWPRRLPFTHEYRVVRLGSANLVELWPLLSAVAAKIGRIRRYFLGD